MRCLTTCSDRHFYGLAGHHIPLKVKPGDLWPSSLFQVHKITWICSALAWFERCSRVCLGVATVLESLRRADHQAGLPVFPKQLDFFFKASQLRFCSLRSFPRLAEGDIVLVAISPTLLVDVLAWIRGNFEPSKGGPLHSLKPWLSLSPITTYQRQPCHPLYLLDSEIPCRLRPLGCEGSKIQDAPLNPPTIGIHPPTKPSEVELKKPPG